MDVVPDAVSGKALAIVIATSAGTLVVEMRLLRRYLAVLFAALIERSRRRDRRSQRRANSAPTGRRREPTPSDSDEFEAEEDTDIHNLIELEREHQRTRRKTGRHPGERPPRKGTHHDR